jgi:hypothetical protein
MTSLLSGLKTNANEAGYYINIGDLRNKIFQRTEPSPAGSNTGVLGGSFSTATWAFSTTLTAVPGGFAAFSTTLATAGQTILRDMGRTVVSSNRTFRKVQYVVPANLAASTFGVSGGAAVTGETYLTGYIEVGFGDHSSGATFPAPVAHYGR